jgi:glycosyltransferase involved in cell wall biosynthesis
VRKESHAGVTIFRALGSTFSPRRFWARAANYLSYFLSACLAGLRLPRADVVVALTDPPIIGLAALLAARRHRARFVFLCQDVFPEVARILEGFDRPVIRRLLGAVSRLLVRRADRVVALGETMRDRLIQGRGADPARLTVIHNWVDCSAIRPGEKRNPFSVAHGLADSFVVMHSGNLGLSQNLEVLLEAAERLGAAPDLVVALVGDGVERPKLEERARRRGLGNVRFIPYQPKTSLTDSFAAADLFVISLKPGLAGYIVPSKLYGILAAGRPYVAAVEEACEVSAITRRHGCGLLAKPGSAEELAEKILTFYRDRALGRRMGARAREAALEFDRNRQVAAYHRLFQEVVA